ncbi:MAG: hypothetical protein AD073_000021 [Mycoplasmataceae bacterium]|nr:MAG: hypothetical protein AD073_000021 [Mycoplasmataceae bacterium]
METFYPLEKRAEFQTLEINNQHLIGKLDLTDFVNLKRIDCS